MGKPDTVAAALAFVCVLVVVPSGSGQQATAGDTLPINGMQMHCEVTGEGPPLLLLHYFGGCTRSWQPHVDELAQGYRLIVPDMRGHGRSTNPSGRFTHRQSALDVFALLDALGIERVKAIGMSSGAMTLIHMATRQPERIETMVLEAGTSYFPEQARAIMGGADSEDISEAELVEARWENGGGSSRGDAQTRMLRRQFHGFKDSYDDMNFTPAYLSTITARTLIVHGDRDEFFPVRIPVQMYEAIPHAYLWILPDTGHDAADAAPEAFRKTALAFLAGEWADAGR